MAIWEWLQELLSELFLRKTRLPWFVYVLMVMAIFWLASYYIMPLIRAAHELGGPDG